ncbi:Carboxypeptidase regulatory-like domain-containing protein [Clostridium acidisoli DSM 12555]|uniref:Carboxypeptidase regulatory-like domain-containing protein n=1 Tax=Clostridium acidisoli DSM 12555 TaxID=1121291 RepID=A0A1W1XKD4_9CLOT|nr:carboxypeptidase-like regulatory domain-containing protein [Clostridium acidisoli]SMC24426.1 Carboxypeptidase regulatory-like domain-containing protein [Clostridium acidisoli DSM 12555]
MKGKSINRLISCFVSICIILTTSIYIKPIVVNADNTSVNTSSDPNNGNWNSENLTLKDTSEADVMTRVGAIDNFGFGWNKTTTSGYGWYSTTTTTFINPFSGATIGHNFPFPTKQQDTPLGINTIMVNSGAYNYIENHMSSAGSLYSNGYTDGYSVSKYPNGYSASNYPLSVAQNGSYFGSGLSSSNQAFTSVQPITIDYSSNQNEYNFTDPTAANYKYIRNAVLQLFVDDFQAGPTSASTNPNASTHRFTGKYHFTINGTEIQEFSDAINSLNQSGPVGQLITLRIPTQYLNLLKTGSIQIKIDDPTTSNAADGYAINFAKLLINDKAIQDYGTVTGKVTSSSGTALEGATVSDSFGDTTTTAADGTYTLSDVPAGLGMLTASLKNYQTAQQNVSVTVGNKTTANFTLQPNTVQQPTISESASSNSNADTNSPRTITVNYADQSKVPAGTKVFYQGPSDTVPFWHDYTGAFTVSSDQTIKAYGMNSDDSLRSNTTQYDVKDILPEKPTFTENSVDGKHKQVTVNFPNSSGVTTSDEVINYQGQGDSTPTDHHVTGTSVTIDIYNNQTISAITSGNFNGWDGSTSAITSKESSFTVSDVVPDKPTITYSDDGAAQEKVTIDFTNTSGISLNEYDISYVDENGVSGNHVITGSNMTYPKYTFDVNKSQTVYAYSKDTKGNQSETAYKVVNIKPPVPLFSEAAATDNPNNKIITIDFGNSSKYSLQNEHVTIQANGENSETDHVAAVTPNAQGEYIETFEVSKDQAITAYSIDTTNVQGNTGNYEVTDINPGDPVINVSPAADGSTHKVVTITYPNSNGGSLIAQNYSISDYSKSNIGLPSTAYAGSFTVSKDERVNAQSETSYVSSSGVPDNEYSNVVPEDITINPDKPTITQNSSYISPAGSSYKEITVNFANNNGENLTDEYINITTVDPVSGIETPETIHKTASDTDFATYYTFIVKSSQTITASDKDAVGTSSDTGSLDFARQSNIDTPTISETKDTAGTSAQAVVKFTSKSDEPTDKVVINIQNTSGNMNYTKTLYANDISGLTPVSTNDGVTTYSYTLSDTAAKITLNGTVITATAYDTADNEQSNPAPYTVTDILPAAPTIESITVSDDEKSAIASISYPNTNGTDVVKELYRIVSNPKDPSLSNDPKDASWSIYPSDGSEISITQGGYLQAIAVDANENISAITTSSSIQLNDYSLQASSNITYVAPTTGTRTDDTGNTATIDYSIMDNNSVVASKTNENNSLNITFTVADNNIKILDNSGNEVSTITVAAGTPIKIVSSTGNSVTTSIKASLSDGSHTVTLASINVQVGNDVSLR